jgi:hypothetical protein
VIGDRSPRTRIIGHGVGALRQSFAQALRPLQFGACVSRPQFGLIADVLGGVPIGVLPATWPALRAPLARPPGWCQLPPTLGCPPGPGGVSTDLQTVLVETSIASPGRSFASDRPFDGAGANALFGTCHPGLIPHRWQAETRGLRSWCPLTSGASELSKAHHRDRGQGGFR